MLGVTLRAPPLNTPKSILLPFTLTSWGSFLRAKAVRISNNSHYIQANRHPSHSLWMWTSSGKCVLSLCLQDRHKWGARGYHTISPNKILPHWGNLARLVPLHKPIIFELSEWKRCESKVSLELFYPSSSENNGVSQRLALMTPLFFIYILKWIWWLWFIFSLLPRPSDHHLGYTRTEDVSRLYKNHKTSPISSVRRSKIYLVKQDHILWNVNVNVSCTYRMRLWMNI